MYGLLRSHVQCMIIAGCALIYDNYFIGFKCASNFQNPPTRFGVHSLLFLCSIQNFVTTCQSKIPSPPNSKNLQNPKSKIPKIQNPKSKIPKFQNPDFAHKDLLHNVPKIQNPKSPKSRKSRIQNPQDPKIQNLQNPNSPKSKIQNPQNPKSNPQNPKSKIPKIQNPVSPTSKIQNSKSPPKSKIWGVGASHKELLHNDPKSKIQKIWPKKFGLGILDFGFGIPAPKSKIQTPQNPKSKIPKIQQSQIPKSKIQNLKSQIPKIQNPQNPKSKILRRNPKFGALGASRKELLPNDPKS